MTVTNLCLKSYRHGISAGRIWWVCWYNGIYDDDDDVNNLYKFIHSNTEEAEDLPENIRNTLKTFSKGKQLRD